jgi:hypothetical protein
MPMPAVLRRTNPAEGGRLHHGTLTVGRTVDECIGWYVMMERTCEAHMKSPDAIPIGHEAARQAYQNVGLPHSGWHYFQWLLRTYVADPTVVG